MRKKGDRRTASSGGGGCCCGHAEQKEKGREDFEIQNRVQFDGAAGLLVDIQRCFVIEIPDPRVCTAETKKSA